MTKGKPKRKIKDSVFTNLFQDRKYLLQMYKALHPEDCDVTEEAFSNLTLQPVLIDAEYNDLGFSVGDRLMILVESQSTWSVNIVVRALMYMVQTYHDYFKRTGQYLYGSGRVNMPRPELYVIYTGDKTDIPDTISLRAEFFDGEKVAVDAEIKVLRQAEKKTIIGQYIIFCKVYDAQMRRHGRTREAVTETIRICRDQNVLREYLEEKEQEVVDIMMALFDEDYIWECYMKDVERKIEKRTAERVEKEVREAAKIEAKEAAKKEANEAAKKAAKKAAKEIVFRMLRNEEPIEKIVQYVPGLSEEEIRELAAELMQPA